MQVWNVLHTARWKCRTEKNAKNWLSGHHRTTLSGYISSQLRHIDNRKKLMSKQQYLLHIFPQYGQFRPTSGWDRFVSLGTPANFNGFRVLAALLHGTLGVSQTAALNRGRHLYSAGRSSRLALAHILVCMTFGVSAFCCLCGLITQNFNGLFMDVAVWNKASKQAHVIRVSSALLKSKQKCKTQCID